MKLKEFFFLLGLKPKPRRFGFTIEACELPRDGRVEFARWLHPHAYAIAPSQAAVDRFRRFLRPGDVAIDIGAHAGDSTLPVALAVGPTGSVLALEPNPYVFPVLEQNARLNPTKTSIIALNFAAMRADGLYDFQYGDAGFMNGGFHEGMSKWQHESAFEVKVQGRNVEAFLTREHPDLITRLRYIKVDAEGFDLAILETLTDLLRRQRPHLQVEMFSIRRSSREYRVALYEFLVAHGYAVHSAEDISAFPGERITRDNVMQWDHYDVFCVPEDPPAE